MTKEAMQPTFHKPIPMNARVVVPAGFASIEPLRGTVVGISSIHVLFFYIVLLDAPLQTPYGEQRAIAVSGSQLDSEDGSNWRLDYPGQADQFRYVRASSDTRQDEEP
jgi:hypothetical protein